MVGIFNLLNAIPSLEHISIARAAAYEVFNIIDTVMFTFSLVTTDKNFSFISATIYHFIANYNVIDVFRSRVLTVVLPVEGQQK